MKKDFTFDGFEPANTTPVPDVLFDVLLKDLNEAELKVLLYIIRRTLGFKKTADAISLNQFQYGIITKEEQKRLDYGCGLKSRSAIIRALMSLEKKGCIQSEKGKDPQGDSATNLYRIKWVVRERDYPLQIGSLFHALPVVLETDYGSTPSALPVVRERDPQETVLQDTDSQETVLQEREGADASAPAHLKKQVDEKIEEVKTASGKHKAVSSHSHGAIGSDEDISLAETAHRIPAVQVPGARSLPLAVTPLSDGQGDTSVQAQISEPVPSRDGAASATAASPQSSVSSGPRASGKPFVVPARPTVIAKQRDLMPEPKPPTDKQINDRRAKEIWAFIEQKLETTFLANQRKASKHTKGIEHLIEDQVTDETIEAGLSRLDQWEIDRFSVNRFYELLPGLLAKHRPGANNNTPPAKQGDQEYGVSGLPKLKPLGSVK